MQGFSIKYIRSVLKRPEKSGREIEVVLINGTYVRVGSTVKYILQRIFKL